MWIEVTKPTQLAALRSKMLTPKGNLQPEVEIVFCCDKGAVFRRDNIMVTVMEGGWPVTVEVLI